MPISPVAPGIPYCDESCAEWLLWELVELLLSHLWARQLLSPGDVLYLVWCLAPSQTKLWSNILIVSFSSALSPSF